MPTVNYAGSDLGFDLYAIEDTLLPPGVPIKVRTGIAVEGPPGTGFVVGDRSSMASKGITYAGGRIVFSTNEDHGTVYALDAVTGDLAWSFEPSPSDYILGSPVVADGVVYAPSDNGHVYALGPASPDQNPLGSVGVVLTGAAIVGAGVLVGVVWIVVRRRSQRGP